MPRNKTFRKRKHDKIQKGGAFVVNTKIESTNLTKYYAYVVKTRKAVGASSSSSSSSSGSSSGSSSIGGGGGVGPGMAGGDVYSLQSQPQIVAVSSLLPEYEYKTTIIDEAQKQLICSTDSKNSGEKAKIIKSTGAGNLEQFVEDEGKDEVITIFELNGGNQTTLNGLTITKENVKWNDYVAC
jgi:hypothetical protein